jgi:aspartyl-tRNA(Asn)/glutamyl-tRNA(Gln) amidotransferase subunit C
MSIGRDEVLHVARLAELAVADGELDRLVGQLNSIVDYVAQLDRVPLDAEVTPFQPGPAAVRLREDEVRPAPMVRGPEAVAPEFVDGFFVVPKRGGGLVEG